MMNIYYADNLKWSEQMLLHWIYLLSGPSLMKWTSLLPFNFKESLVHATCYQT